MTTKTMVMTAILLLMLIKRSIWCIEVESLGSTVKEWNCEREVREITFAI